MISLDKLHTRFMVHADLRNSNHNSILRLSILLYICPLERNKRDAPFCRECAGRRILVLCTLKACNHNENTQDQKED